MTRMTSKRWLVAAWGVLVTSTLLSMWTGQAGATDALTTISAILLLGLAGVKSTMILWAYLDLAHSTRGWQTGFMVFIFGLLAVVLATFLLAPVVQA